MATILVVDDHPINREFLVTLLGYRGHHLLQAADGAEALQVARAEHPDLMISDILMPTMDGYELVRQLRADANLGHLPVIFSTVHYLDQEASTLAHQCDVRFILPKPSDPETALGLVDAALGLTSSSITPPVEEVFDREHLRLMTNQLAHKAAELQRLKTSWRRSSILAGIWCRSVTRNISWRPTAGALERSSAPNGQLWASSVMIRPP
jgi:CheY-like chemotaxis protein